VQDEGQPKANSERGRGVNNRRNAGGFKGNIILKMKNVKKQSASTNNITAGLRQGDARGWNVAARRTARI
jgi:hypothetical protein